MSEKNNTDSGRPVSLGRNFFQDKSLHHDVFSERQLRHPAAPNLYERFPLRPKTLGKSLPIAFRA